MIRNKIMVRTKIIATLISIVLILSPGTTLLLSGCNDLSGKQEATIALKEQQDVVVRINPDDITEEKISEAAQTNIKSAEESDIKNTSDSPGQKTGTHNEIIFSFSVCGDNRPADDFLPQPEVFLEILDLIKDEDISFHINTGDIINGATDNSEIIQRQFKDFLSAVEVLPVIDFVAPGNHDVANQTSMKLFLEIINKNVFKEAELSGFELFTTDSSNNIVEIKKIPEDEIPVKNYYYFEFMENYFIILNAYEKEWGTINPGQLAWLDQVLKKLINENVFVFVHPPLYSYLNPETVTDGSKHVAFSNKENQDYIIELFKLYNVDGVFHSHEHMYNKQFHDGITYIITGLSGAYAHASEEEGGFYHYVRVDVRKDSWILNVIKSDGTLYYQEKIALNK
jgi:hypothetical protein